MHFFHRNLETFEKELRRKLHNCQIVAVQNKYGASPDKTTRLYVKAENCPTFVAHATNGVRAIAKHLRQGV